MISLLLKTCNIILTEKQQKYQHHQQIKLIVKNILQEEILFSNQSQKTELAKFTYCSLGKSLEKQAKKQVSALKFLRLSNKTDELKPVERTFP